jgi:hypothetical protein
MVRKWKLGATGTAILATTFVVVACSSKGDDDSNNNSNGAKGGTGAGGSSGTTGVSGHAGTGTGGTGTGGTGTGGSSGTGTGGSTTGGSSGTGTGGGAGTGTAGMAGGAGASGFACTSPVTATCDSISDWGSFTNGMFGGGLYVYGTGVAYDMTDKNEMHITGMVSDYSGFGIYFNSCSTIAAYNGVTFTLSGNTMSVDNANKLRFVIQTNSDEPIDTTNKKGTCPGMAGNGCNSPRKEGIMPSATAQSVAFSDLGNGQPVATLNPAEVVGIQWQIDPDASKMPFSIDLKLDDFKFTNAAMSAPIPCTAASSSGGMGGMGAGGASGGAGSGAGGASGGQGGASGGMGGASGGMSGGGGRSGGGGASSGGASSGGMSGGGGRGGRAGAAGG